EWLVTHDCLLTTQRKRCLALLGKRIQDALRDNPLALRWVRAQIGAHLGQSANVNQVDAMLGGIPVQWMSRNEFDIRVKEMIHCPPPKDEAHALLVSYVAEEIGRLEELLETLEPLAERNRALEAQQARVDTTAEGCKLSSYILASYRGADTALRRLEAQ